MPYKTVPNSRMFGQLFVTKIKIMGASLSGRIVNNYQCLDCIQSLYSGRYELVLHVKVCFVKLVCSIE